jgi:hypothetical protein
MQNKPVINNHWDMFTHLIRLSNKIGEASEKEALSLRRNYEISEQIFYQVTCQRFGVTAFHGEYYEVVKYKGKPYYFKVTMDPVTKTCSIKWTTETFGWAHVSV